MKDDNRVSEGDINDTDARKAWYQQLSQQTRMVLQRDADVFLNQTLSSPCLQVLKESKGTTFTDIENRVCLDFHGNYVHNVGFWSPRSHSGRY